MIDLRLANHCRRMLAQQPRRLGLVEADRARGPAIGKGEPLSSRGCPGQVAVGKPMTVRMRRCALPSRGSRPPVSGSSARMRVEMHRRLGHADALTPWSRSSDADRSRVSASSSHAALGHEVLDKLQARDRSGRRSRLRSSAPIRGLAGSPLVEPALRRGGLFGRRQPEEGQVVAALEMRARLLELRAALGIDEARPDRETGSAG